MPFYASGIGGILDIAVIADHTVVVDDISLGCGLRAKAIGDHVVEIFVYREDETHGLRVFRYLIGGFVRVRINEHKLHALRRIVLIDIVHAVVKRVRNRTARGNKDDDGSWTPQTGKTNGIALQVTQGEIGNRGTDLELLTERFA